VEVVNAPSKAEEDSDDEPKPVPIIPTPMVVPLFKPPLNRIFENHQVTGGWLNLKVIRTWSVAGALGFILFWVIHVKSQ